MFKNILVVIDMLNDFISPGGALYSERLACTMAPVANKIKEYAKKRDPVIFAYDNHEPDDVEFKLFPPHCIKETWGSEIHDYINKSTPYSLETRSGLANNHNFFNIVVVPKTKFDAFAETYLGDFLAKIADQSTQFEITGICTSICVMDTVSGFINHGYGNIVIPENCVADLTQEDHEYALKRMQRLYGVRVI